MTSAAELYALQELDLALQANRSELADIEERLGESEEVVAAGRLLEERQQALREAEKQFKEREFEADELREKIDPVEKRLYEGGVQNPKELEGLQQDLEMLRRRRSQLEDLALAAMDAVELAQAAVDEARSAFQAAAGDKASEQEELHAREAVLNNEVAELEVRRAAQAERIDEGAMRLYDQLVSTRQGRAVAKVEGGACGGCRISLPMNLLQRARSGATQVQCSSCERILYVS
ncbi:MAG: hypothetical protein WD939_00190 [Dehalococcoidia bacterium]